MKSSNVVISTNQERRNLFMRPVACVGFLTTFEMTVKNTIMLRCPPEADKVEWYIRMFITL